MIFFYFNQPIPMVLLSLSSVDMYLLKYMRLIYAHIIRSHRSCKQFYIFKSFQIILINFKQDL